MPKIRVNGAEFYYEVSGEGHPLVLIAGYSCDHTFWQPIIEPLCQYFQILNFDNRAIGQTKDAGIPLSADLMAEDVIQLCEHLNLHQPHVIGHSMGGSIAQTVAALYPDKISKLGLLTSAAKWTDPGLSVLEKLLQMRKDNIEFNVIVDECLPWIYSERFLQDKKNVEVAKKVILENPFPQSVEDQSRQFELLKQLDGREQLKLISSPTLIVCGSRDILAPALGCSLMQKQIELSQLIELDCAHGVTLEIPDQLVDTLINFF